jgi:hypothetical protein
MWTNPWRAHSPWPNDAPPVERTELPPPPPPPVEEPLPNIEGTPEQQRDALLAVMRTSRQTYNASPLMQRKLLQINRAIETGEPIPVAAPDPVAAEIGRLENLMFENRSAYNKDQRAQERLRELYAKREARR